MIVSQKTRSAEIVLQHIQPHQFSQVIRLHRAVFPPEQVARTIYACKGIDRYLASLVAFPRLQREHVLIGAWKQKELIGYAHFRALADSWHLNNIAVHDAYQGQGVGSRLWHEFVESARGRKFRQVTLDVESSNRSAVDWYQRKGLTTVAAVWRYEKVLSSSRELEEGERSPQLSGWDQAEAWQAVYGFSQFQLHWEGRDWVIGRIGSSYFKTIGLLPAVVESALCHIDPSRHLLIFSGKPLDNRAFIPLGKSLRMSGYLD
ncbi:MAG: GNAT family N-acetyltransferase [Chloroflexi bacterium]|nr:GNAT family N-acetyltransferase [Chloroflexota bacterium]